jgi:outer membrane receptor protein involved in Fe transport
VVPGDRVPGVPNHAVKVRAEVVESHWVLGAGVVAQSDQFARGDENNRDRNGAVPGFAVLNLDVSYAIAPRWQVFARIDNALDRRYSTFGVLGRNVFTAPADSFDPSGETWRSEQFRSVGAPRSVWVGIALRAGSKGQSAR